MDTNELFVAIESQCDQLDGYLKDYFRTEVLNKQYGSIDPTNEKQIRSLKVSFESITGIPLDTLATPSNESDNDDLKTTTDKTLRSLGMGLKIIGKGLLYIIDAFISLLRLIFKALDKLLSRWLEVRKWGDRAVEALKEKTEGAVVRAADNIKEAKGHKGQKEGAATEGPATESIEVTKGKGFFSGKALEVTLTGDDAKIAHAFAGMQKKGDVEAKAKDYKDVGDFIVDFGAGVTKGLDVAAGFCQYADDQVKTMHNTMRIIRKMSNEISIGNDSAFKGGMGRALQLVDDVVEAISEDTNEHYTGNVLRKLRRPIDLYSHMHIEGTATEQAWTLHLPLVNARYAFSFEQKEISVGQNKTKSLGLVHYDGVKQSEVKVSSNEVHIKSELDANASFLSKGVMKVFDEVQSKLNALFGIVDMSEINTLQKEVKSLVDYFETAKAKLKGNKVSDEEQAILNGMFALTNYFARSLNNRILLINDTIKISEAQAKQANTAWKWLVESYPKMCKHAGYYKN